MTKKNYKPAPCTDQDLELDNAKMRTDKYYNESVIEVNSNIKDIPSNITLKEEDDIVSVLNSAKDICKIYVTSWNQEGAKHIEQLTLQSDINMLTVNTPPSDNATISNLVTLNIDTPLIYEADNVYEASTTLNVGRYTITGTLTKTTLDDIIYTYSIGTESRKVTIKDISTIGIVIDADITSDSTFKLTTENAIIDKLNICRKVIDTDKKIKHISMDGGTELITENTVVEQVSFNNQADYEVEI